MWILTVAIALHALAAVVWVGGMAFAYWFLRPAVGVALVGPERQRLWREVFAGFFPMVWLAIVALLGTGYSMVFGVFGGFAAVGIHVHVMHAIALLMTLIFVYVYAFPWRKFRAAVDAADFSTGAARIESIRRLIAINLTLGLIVVVVGASGPYWP